LALRDKPIEVTRSKEGTLLFVTRMVAQKHPRVITSRVMIAYRQE